MYKSNLTEPISPLRFFKPASLAKAVLFSLFVSKFRITRQSFYQKFLFIVEFVPIFHFRGMTFWTIFFLKTFHRLCAFEP